MPLKRGHGVSSGAEFGVVVGIGVAVAGLGLAASALGMASPAKGLSKTKGRVKPALKAEDVKWDADGRILNWPQLLKIIQNGGVVPGLRAQMWPFLLGVHPPDSTAAERALELCRLKNLYTKLVLVCEELDAQLEAAKRAQEEAAARAKAQPQWARLSPEKAPMPGNLASFAEAHRIIVMDAVRTDMRMRPSDVVSLPFSDPASGFSTASSASHYSSCYSNATLTVLPVSSGEGLPELMLAEPPQPGPAAAVANGEVPVWVSPLAAATLEGTASHVSGPARRAMMRLINVLSAYAVHDPESGYCQGMSDLAAAFVQLIGDDALAFACFERLMRGARRNFRHDETGIKTQLARVSRILCDTDPALYRKLESLGSADCTFVYRMVLVMLRRELPLGEALTLWEVKWALEAAAAAEEIAAAGPSSAATPTASPTSSPSALAATVASMEAATRVAVAAAAAAAPEGQQQHSRNNAQRPAAVERSRSGSRRVNSVAAAPAPPDFILQFVAAAVRAQRGKILAECQSSDDILRMFTTVKIDFWAALAQARKQHKAYAQGMTVLERLYS